MSIYLIRHAQSAFNAVYGPNKPDPMIFDAPLQNWAKLRLSKLAGKSKSSILKTSLFRRSRGHCKQLS